MSYSLVPQQDAVKRSKARLRDNINRPWGLYGIDTGIHPLNMLIGGWIPGKLTTIAARSGIGKTALTSSFFSRGAEVVNGKRAHYLFMTWEMESSYLVDRHVCRIAGITNAMLTQGAKLLGPKTKQLIKSAYLEADTIPVLYQELALDVEKATAVITSFIEKCKDMADSEGVGVQPVIVIDYIQMADFQKVGTRTYGIGDFMNFLKQTANKTGSAVCVFAQIKRTADDRGSMPQRNDILDSGAIENASDNLVLLHRPEYYYEEEMTDPNTVPPTKIEAKNKMLIRMLKGRDFGLGDRVINCEVKYYRFWDLQASRWDYPYWQNYNDESFWKRQFGFEDVSDAGQVSMLNK